MSNNIWLIGAGVMAQDYIKVLNSIDKDRFTVIGNSSNNVDLCKTKYGCRAFSGGLDKFLIENKEEKCDYAIVATPVPTLYDITSRLIEKGVKNILIEKPGAVTLEELEDLKRKSNANDVRVSIAYNRRFFSHINKLKSLIEDEGGVKSFNFEFTEWSHVIGNSDIDSETKDVWVISNSSHVIDLAFFVAGKPQQMSSFTSGSVDWHQSSAVFSGAGVSTTGALFSYNANWCSAGRWSIEFLTNQSRYVLRPMEKLQVQKRGELVIREVSDIDYKDDEDFKPGLMKQTLSFLSGNCDSLCSLESQIEAFSYYRQIANY